MSETLQISAKHLGALALNSGCKRCYWLRLRLRNRLPYAVFPSIFSKIDAYTKLLVHGWFDTTGNLPPWLFALHPLSGYVEPPSFHKFRIYDKASNIDLTGSPDAVFRRPNGAHVIADYKTAYPEHDGLLPMYVIQLNVYAAIGEQCGLSPVDSLALIYTTPLTDQSAAELARNRVVNGFAMGFEVTIKSIGFMREQLPVLMAEVRRIFELPSPPPGQPGCKDCKYLAGLMDLVGQLDNIGHERHKDVIAAAASTQVDSPMAGIRFGGAWLPYGEERPNPLLGFQR